MNHLICIGLAAQADVAAANKPRHHKAKGRRSSLVAFLLGSLVVQALSGCGGGSNGQSAVTTASRAPSAAPTIQSEPGDAWQGRYVGTVSIAGVQYFGDALLTADGLIRLYVGGPGGDDGTIQETVPAASAQLIGTLHGQTNQISGDGLVFGQECADSAPIRYCAEVGQANISLAVASVDSQADIQGEILVTTSAGTDSWSLDLTAWSNYYSLPAARGSLAGHYREKLAEFSAGGDTIISIAADGSLSLQSPSSGCTGNGQTQPHLDGMVNVYDVSLSVSGCQTPYAYLNGTFSGLATTTPSDYWDYDELLRMWLSQDAVPGSLQPALTLLGLPE